jgi:hypothetical protein
LLKPYVSAGAGWEFGGDESAWIYDWGLRSRYRIGSDRGTTFSLVNRLSLAGYNPSGGPHEPLGMFALGLDIRVPTGRELFERPIVLSILPVYYYYFRKLGFGEIQDRDNTVREETELALSLLARQPFKVLGIEVDRLGIAVRSGDGVTGFRFFTTLPF